MVESVEARFPAIHRISETALLVEFGDCYSRKTSLAVLAFDTALQSAPAGVLETAPTIRSVLLEFDPQLIEPASLIDWCQSLLGSRNWYNDDRVGGGTVWELPVAYGGEMGPDLAEFAEFAGKTAQQIIEAHTGRELTVLCLGFSPGLAYLAELPEEFLVPRRSTSGKPVPAGSILVANRQTVLPATPIPTGWRCIGRTPARTFLPGNADPFLFSPGDRIRFTQVTQDEFNSFDQRKLMEEGGIDRT